MADLKLIPREEFGRAGDDLSLLADMCRVNALVAVKRAGSGHLGSTFSSLDVVVHLLGWRRQHAANQAFELPQAGLDQRVPCRRRGFTCPPQERIVDAIGEKEFLGAHMSRLVWSVWRHARAAALTKP